MKLFKVQEDVNKNLTRVFWSLIWIGRKAEIKKNPLVAGFLCIIFQSFQRLFWAVHRQPSMRF